MLERSIKKDRFRRNISIDPFLYAGNGGERNRYESADEGYTIGGKTGTAEKIPRNKKDYYVSFIGFTPVEKPELLVM